MVQQGNIEKYIRWGLFAVLYLGLLYLCGRFWGLHQELADLHQQDEVEASYEGNDWVIWVDGENGVEAKHTHPLVTHSSPNPQELVQPGDILRKIDYNDIYKVRTVNTIIESAPPDKIFIFQISRKNATKLGEEEVLNLFVVNGARLSFTFNGNGILWQLIVWVVGIASFVALLILLILFPIVRSNWRDYLPLLFIALLAVCFFLLQLIRYGYILVSDDLAYLSFEKGFLMAYVGLLFTYGIQYVYFKARQRRLWVMLPSILGGGFFMLMFGRILFVTDQLRIYIDLIESYSLMFFLLHFLVALGLSFARGGSRTLWQYLQGILVGSAALVCLLYYATWGETNHAYKASHEVLLMVFSGLSFFPLIHSTAFQLQFGKVSFVLTQTIQYIIFFAVTIFAYLILSQVFEYLLGNNPYRGLLEIISLVLVMMLFRGVYNSNERRFRPYFISTQQQKTEEIKAFIARIPQYTASDRLTDDLKEQLGTYFQTDAVELWWKERQFGAGALPQREEIYSILANARSIWARNKELSPFRFEGELTREVNQSPYVLVCPVSVNESIYGLLLLGNKRRGVYNLSDVELIAQLIQQTQLTLNVLQLVNREKELLQQTYEANLTALRSQINPHFLFNTLNTISALIHDSPDLAEEAIEKLAFIFRYTSKYPAKTL